MNKHERMMEQIRKHGEELNAAFGLTGDPLALCKRLHRIEARAHRAATDYCNGVIDAAAWEKAQTDALLALERIFGDMVHRWGMFVNGDARGYALKVSDEAVKHYRETGGRFYTDWGGYGIICPEFDGETR